jgi:hypothetical protein
LVEGVRLFTRFVPHAPLALARAARPCLRCRNFPLATTSSARSHSCRAHLRPSPTASQAHSPYSFPLHLSVSLSRQLAAAESHTHHRCLLPPPKLTTPSPRPLSQPQPAGLPRRRGLQSLLLPMAARRTRPGASCRPCQSQGHPQAHWWCSRTAAHRRLPPRWLESTDPGLSSAGDVVFHYMFSSVSCGCCVCCNSYIRMLQAYVSCCKHMFQVFQLFSDVCFKCFICLLKNIWMLHNMHVSSVCFQVF